MPVEKSFLKSKTFWFSIITFVGGFVPAVQSFLATNPEVFGTVWAFCAVLLRFSSKGAIVLVDNK